MEWGLSEVKTLAAMEEQKAKHLLFATTSCMKLLSCLKTGKEDCFVTQRETERLFNSLAKFKLYSGFVDTCLDYFYENGEPENGKIEQAITILAQSVLGLIESSPDQETEQI